MARPRLPDRRALPSLVTLNLGMNPLCDAGLAALAPALRQLPELRRLFLYDSNIGDAGVASLVGQPTAQPQARSNRSSS